MDNVIRGEYLIPSLDISTILHNPEPSRDILHSYPVVFWQLPDNTIFYDTTLTDTNIFLVLRIILASRVSCVLESNN